jgi:methionine-rich copper-binding protein CopC
VVIALNTVGRTNMYVSFVLRDIDGTTDNAVQPVAVQYRIGATGTYVNLPAGFVADATSGPSEASLVTPVEVGLPADANDKSIVNVRIITANAGGNDEWVGIDDISVIAADDDAPTVQSTAPAGGAVDVRLDADLSVTFSEPVHVAAGWSTISCNRSGAHAASVSGGPTFFTIDPTTDFAHSDRCTLTVRARSVTDQDAIDPPDRLALDKVVTFTTLPPDDGPTVTATNPVDGATDVPVGTNLGVTFSEPVDLAAGWYTIACGTSGAHAAGVSGGPTSFTLDPSADFGYAETCTLTVHGAGVTDQDSNDPPDTLAGDTTVSFTTPPPPDDGPAVVSTTPADGATDVAVGTVLDVTFSEPVDVGAGWSSISCATSGPHTALASGGPTAFSLDPDTDFAPSEVCTLTVHATQVTDQDTNDPPDAMAADTVVSFTTAAPDVAPSVAATTPADGASDVALAADVTISFDEPVDVTGAWYSIVCTVSGAHPTTVTGGPTTFTLDPTTDLANDESCTVTVVAAGVSDQDANDPPDTMATDATFGFSTVEAPPPGGEPPSVDAGGPYAVVEGGSVTVSATGSDPDGDPIDYAWDLDGDGTYETAGETATFSAAGITAPASRTIRVRGSDPGGMSDNDAATVNVIWPTGGGFGPPIGGGSGPVTANAGSVVPVKFSLGGDRGPNPLRAGYPASEAYTCGTALPPDASEPADSVGKGGLKYDSSTDTYSFNWKTDKAWKNSCRVFVVGLKDGTNLSVGFTFN